MINGYDDLKSIAPAYFVVPDDNRTVVIEQSHRRESLRKHKGEGPLDYWARVTVRPDRDRVRITLSTEQGRYQEEKSYLTLDVAQVRELSEHLLKAAQNVEESNKELAT